MNARELPAGWTSLLRHCDFNIACRELRNLFEIGNKEAAAHGEVIYYRAELVKGWRRFAEDPTFNTAVAFLEGAPDYAPGLFWGYFIECCPGGRWAFYDSLLKGRVAEWRLVPAEQKYWHPINGGFNSSNAKFMCSECGSQYPLTRCSDCGGENSQLGKTAVGLPGVFCEECGMGAFSWRCPACSAAHKTIFAFYYDIRSVQVRKKRFWD